MEKLVAMMAFCEAPLDGTSASLGAAGYGASATGDGSNVLALLDAAAKKWPPMESLVATMAFCEAPLDGISAPSSGAARGDSSASATGVGNVVALLESATKKWPVKRLVATMAFCEAPLDGTFDGTSAPSSSSGAAGGCSASATNVPEASGGGGGGGDAAALRRAWLADAKKAWPLRSERLLRQKAGTVVDGLTIFETVALE